MRSLRPDKALQLPSAGRGFMGQRRPTSLPSQGGACRLIAHSNRERIEEFRYSDRVTGNPEVILARSLSAVSEAPTSEELGVETLCRGASDTAT